MGELKKRSVTSCKLWREAGRPRSGPILINQPIDMVSDLGSAKKTEVRDTNDLHEALLRKQGTHFWK